MTAILPEQIRGTYTAIVTPFKDEKSGKVINFDTLDKLVENQIKARVEGIVVAGCTGAAAVLSHREQVMLVKYVQKHFGNRITVIAGDGSNSTDEAVELAQNMERHAKVFTHLSISPYYNKPNDRGILEHYIKIARSIEGDLILYSVPGRTSGKGILPYIAAQLADIPNIIGIKEASGKIDRIKETIRLTENKDFFVISGDDGLTVDIIEAGGVGVISVASNVDPADISEMVDAALDGDFGKARSIRTALMPLICPLFPYSDDINTSPNPIPCHYALQLMGFNVGYPRSPLHTEPYESEKKAISDALKGLDLIK